MTADSERTGSCVGLVSRNTIGLPLRLRSGFPRQGLRVKEVFEKKENFPVREYVSWLIKIICSLNLI
jgi:hypothetical protein